MNQILFGHHEPDPVTTSEIQPGSIIPYLVHVVLLVDIPVFGRIKIPLDKSGEIPVPYKPDVDVDKIKFHHFSFEETTATIHLSLENKFDFDLGLNLLQYEMWLGDDSVVNAELTDSTKIEKQGITKMQIPFKFRPKDLGSAVWDMIRGRGTGYTIKGKIDVDTPFGNMKLPIDKVGGTTKLKKDDDDDKETSRFREHMAWRLEQKKEYFGEHVEEIVDVCTETGWSADAIRVCWEHINLDHVAK